MKFLASLVVLLGVFALLGCSSLPERPVEGNRKAAPIEERTFTYEQPQFNAYDQPRFDEIIDYIGYLSRLSPSQRLAECGRVLRSSQNDKSLEVQLHLAFAQLLSPECGDRSTILLTFEAAKKQVKDPHLRQFLAYHAAISQRLHDCAGQRNALNQTLERQQKNNQELGTQLSTCETELKAAQSKLDALKLIEQNLNQRKGSKNP